MYIIVHFVGIIIEPLLWRQEYVQTMYAKVTFNNISVRS